jgi:hypothetical protein
VAQDGLIGVRVRVAQMGLGEGAARDRRLKPTIPFVRVISRDQPRDSTDLTDQRRRPTVASTIAGRTAAGGGFSIGLERFRETPIMSRS